MFKILMLQWIGICSYFLQIDLCSILVNFKFSESSQFLTHIQTLYYRVAMQKASPPTYQWHSPIYLILGLCVQGLICKSPI